MKNLIRKILKEETDKSWDWAEPGELPFDAGTKFKVRDNSRGTIFTIDSVEHEDSQNDVAKVNMSWNGKGGERHWTHYPLDIVMNNFDEGYWIKIDTVKEETDKSWDWAHNVNPYEGVDELTKMFKEITIPYTEDCRCECTHSPDTTTTNEITISLTEYLENEGFGIAISLELDNNMGLLEIQLENFYFVLMND